MAVCTVIGFPNGYNTTAAKAFETAEAVKDGADEVDMVINMGWVKDRGERPDHAGDPIRQRGGRQPDIEGDHRDLLPGRRGEDTDVPGRDRGWCGLYQDPTGFGSGGATFEDVALFARHVGEGVQIKAAGNQFHRGRRGISKA